MRRKLPIYVERSIQQTQAYRVQQADTFNRRFLGNESVPCRSGCSACCHHPLNITVMEGISLYGALVEKGLWTTSFKANMRETAATTAGLSFEVWLLTRIACPLLDAAGHCVVYEDRPFQCRVTVATGDPFFCDPQRLGPDTTIANRNDEMADFKQYVTRVLRKHGLMYLTMPVGRAVLMAEQVCSGRLTLEAVDRTYLSEYLADEA